MYNNMNMNSNMLMNTTNNMMMNSPVAMTNNTLINDNNYQMGAQEYAQNKGMVKTTGDMVKTK